MNLASVNSLISAQGAPSNDPVRTLALAFALAVALLAPPIASAQQSESTYLRWTSSSDAAANPSLTYNVYRASFCSGAFTKLNTAPVTSTTYLDNQPPPGTYCYRVTAVLNGIESAPSNLATATILLLETQPGPSYQPSAASSDHQPPASAKAPCSHTGDLVNWIRCVAAKARALIAPPLPVR